MAEIKCKECGKEISSKAESCPNCGAILKKKTSIVAWLFLVLIIALAVSSVTKTDKGTDFKPNPTITNDSNSEEKPTADSTTIKIKKPEWTTTSTHDEMSGKISHYAMGKLTLPNRQMGFPYGNVSSRLVVGCDKEDRWVYIAFNDSPNFTKDKTRSGYSVIDTRIKFDESLDSHEFTQDWGSKFVHFSRDEAIIEKIKSSNILSVEFQWHREQPVLFKFNLTGSAKAINDIHSECIALIE